MPDPDQIARDTAEMIRKWSAPDPRRAARRRRKKRQVRRILRGIFFMVLTPFVVIPLMIATGVFAGRFAVGMFATPALVMVAWFLILNWMLKRRVPLPKAPEKGASLASLPVETEEWLEQQRLALPSVAKGRLDSISEQIAALSPQLEGLDPDGPDGNEVKRLLAEELPELVSGYKKVPRALAQKPLYDGPSPERRLLDGLETIDKQIAHLHERLAAGDLKALATHSRYLELKYKSKDELE